ncbi:unnamed protein product [Parascedosporium putredinis]|uniref:LYR motif-containing protein 2 n=1 Tax=Parascedosporium putredinis TaxID=1442378 RepID=A0A9P1MFJ0_9PEZI|nr:unnamed protein product [Parascedosporium putredinis]CAI8003547.1 unnamed protein product [Parascedosporium putredinis]
MRLSLLHARSFSSRPGSSPRLKAALSLDHLLPLDQFIQRGRVLSLYRTILRDTRRIPDKRTRKETVGFARAEFESHKNVTDLQRQKLTLQCSHRFFTELCTFIPRTCSNTPTLTAAGFTDAKEAGIIALCARPNAWRGAAIVALVAARERAPNVRMREELMFLGVFRRKAKGSRGVQEVAVISFWAFSRIFRMEREGGNGGKSRGRTGASWVNVVFVR